MTVPALSLTEERIAHATTVQTPLGLSQERMQNLIRSGGKEPAERGTLYEPVTRDEVEYELEFAHDGANRGRDKYHLHLRCFALWELERTKVDQ